jgi:hypothetical protein
MEKKNNDKNKTVSLYLTLAQIKIGEHVAHDALNTDSHKSAMARSKNNH